MGDFCTQMALKIAPHIFLRPGELAGLRWSEIVFSQNLITIPAERIKMKHPHVVPLSKLVKGFIYQLQQFSGDTEYLFPSPRTNSHPMSE
ncbi:MAG: hypothetical protein ISEC1_P0865 [Thiomicrorhabdus sp.]|nr:MAG: hypothetical protein ISEC1_P0865 [Thiomicrorhabdus sp.]